MHKHLEIQKIPKIKDNFLFIGEFFQYLSIIIIGGTNKEATLES